MTEQEQKTALAHSSPVLVSPSEKPVLGVALNKEIISIESGLFQELLSYNNLVHATAGGFGSIVAMGAFYPLDMVRTRLQVDEERKAVGPWKAMKTLIEEEGVGTLYRGLAPVLTSLYCSNFVYFYAFHGFKAVAKANNIHPRLSLDLLFGYVAGCVNALATTPLWVVNTRLRLQNDSSGKKTNTERGASINRPYKGLLDGILRIAREEGVKSLWSGLDSSFILCGNPAIHFMVYESVKRFLLKMKRLRSSSPSLSSFEFFLIGGFAKAVATVVTYPLQLAQCKQRAGKQGNLYSKKSMMEIIADIFGNSGFLGLFKGMEAKLYQTVLTAALMFVAYEKIVRVIYALFRVKDIAKQH